MKLIVFNSCEEEEDINGVVADEMVEIRSGNANFDNFVSIGASITAGTTDGSLFLLLNILQTCTVVLLSILC